MYMAVSLVFPGRIAGSLENAKGFTRHFAALKSEPRAGRPFNRSSGKIIRSWLYSREAGSRARGAGRRDRLVMWPDASETRELLERIAATDDHVAAERLWESYRAPLRRMIGLRL